VIQSGSRKPSVYAIFRFGTRFAYIKGVTEASMGTYIASVSPFEADLMSRIQAREDGAFTECVPGGPVLSW
jgi:hypothetical protein